VADNYGAQFPGHPLSVEQGLWFYRTGINIDDDSSCYRARVRFGIALNDESSTSGLTGVSDGIDGRNRR
jgi:hypothetical protein